MDDGEGSGSQRRERHRDYDEGEPQRRRSSRDEYNDGEPESSSSSKHGRRRHRRSKSGDSGESDETIDLPERFDQDGGKKAERGGDPLAGKIEDVLSGKGTAGRIFQKFAGGMGGSASEEGGSKRRR